MAARARLDWTAFATLALATASCTATSRGTDRPAAGGPPTSRAEAYEQLQARLDTFHVSGGVRTAEGLLLPEEIVIEIRSEICVESREPGARFWSLEYDTCFVYVARDSVDERGEYSVSIPCIDADATYESRYPFGDLRLVQKGPVSFLALSDAGWKHQETFSSSRTQRRDLVVSFEPETFWVVQEGAQCRARPRRDAPLLGTYPFGTAVDVVRFHQGWAQVLVEGRRIGWMEMRFLGTRREMEEAAPFKRKPAVERIRPGERRSR